jgi:hypothetical protein
VPARSCAIAGSAGSSSMARQTIARIRFIPVLQSATA